MLHGFSRFSSGDAREGVFTRRPSSAYLVSQFAWRSDGGIRTVAKFGRMVAHGRLESRGMGYRNWAGFEPECRRSGSSFLRETGERDLQDLLRCDVPRLVCGGNVRLMYTELHARSAFSFLEGASLPEEMIG